VDVATTMVRKLKYHEATLLRKTDFINWKSDKSVREVKILRRYHVQEREDYHTYNKICGMVTKLTTMLKNLDQKDPVRIDVTDLLLDKLYGLGLIQTKRLLSCDKIAASTLCRRRLPVVLVRLKFAETMKEAVALVEQGHIRVGPHSVTDPAYLVSRTMEDHVTWVDTSRIKRTIMKYNDKLDDYDLL
jgi:U3 small nucleolar ribonucleoprotein protein IMP3